MSIVDDSAKKKRVNSNSNGPSAHKAFMQDDQTLNQKDQDDSEMEYGEEEDADHSENEEDDEENDEDDDEIDAVDAGQYQDTERDHEEIRQNRTTYLEFDHSNGRIFLSSDKKKSHLSNQSQNEDSIKNGVEKALQSWNGKLYHRDNQKVIK